MAESNMPVSHEDIKLFENNLISSQIRFIFTDENSLMSTSKCGLQNIMAGKVSDSLNVIAVSTQNA